ncbi:YggS family pyridoxal phosphate-dependent enzyme [Rothia terrae]|uniref:YggS family pyridoxal phosphate-dependent enzyme n=1 Tax=Rothia terrae TaxID=396015 RepID=UPI0038221CF9
MNERVEELRARLEKVQDAIAEASTDYSAVRNETSRDVELMVVTKFFPASDVKKLYSIGVRHVGENRDQEASVKARDLDSLTLNNESPLRWSFIGQLQTNKAKSVVRYATDVHSVDRPSLAKALAKAYTNQLNRYEAEEDSAPLAHSLGGLKCFVQVSLDEDAAATAGQAAEGKRGGSDADVALEIAQLLEELPGLSCAGVMGVPPLGGDPDQAFERLYGISSRLREQFPHADQISAGMSGDMESAIRWGSTIVRVGSQIMGPRPLVQ